MPDKTVIVPFIPPPPDPKAKECFVAFIDILGFSQMIEEDKGEGSQLKIIKNAIDTATSFMEERQQITNHPDHYWYQEFKVKSFSDCFCISVPLEFDNGSKDYIQNFVSFYTWLEVFCNTLLANGFLCRGGITQGWHYFDNKIIFSKALVDAYLLESKQANHPMVMLHPNLIIKLRENNFLQQACYTYLFVHDDAGKTFLHPFNYGIGDHLFFGTNGKTLEEAIEERDHLIRYDLDIINKNIKKLTGSPAVEKWQWMKEFAQYTLSGRGTKFKPGFFGK